MSYGEKEITPMPGELQNQPTADCDQEPGRICSRSDKILSLRLVLATPLRWLPFRGYDQNKNQN